MIVKWEVLRGGTKYNVYDGDVSWQPVAQNIGAPSKRNIVQRGPQQHGHSIVDFRYDARTIRLAYTFAAENLAAAARRRDEVYEIWKGVAGLDVQLRGTRHDGVVLQIDGEVTGVVDMPINLDERLWGVQRFAVQLECGDPFWYDPAEKSTSFTEADGEEDWELALGTIGANAVEEHVENPTQGQSIADTVDIANGAPWTVFARTNVTMIPPPSTERLIRAARANDQYIAPRLHSTGGNVVLVLNVNAGLFSDSVNGVFATGTRDYFFVSTGTEIAVYRDATLIGTMTGTETPGIDGSFENAVWRGASPEGSSAWTPEVPFGAIYNIALNSNQRLSLRVAAGGVIATSKTIEYGGSWQTHPIIKMAGPITDPVLTNVSTNEKLDFTGTTISTGDVYTIDCRYGFKTVRNAAGDNKIADLSSDSDLATFHIAPDPDVPGGDNAITLTGTGTDENTKVTVSYHERFIGI